MAKVEYYRNNVFTRIRFRIKWHFIKKINHEPPKWATDYKFADIKKAAS